MHIRNALMFAAVCGFALSPSFGQQAEKKTTEMQQSTTSTPSRANSAAKEGKKKGQQLVLPETDPNSLRHTKLKSTSPDDKDIVRLDTDEDGDPDILERWWNGSRVRWFDENDDMTAVDLMGDLSDDSLQIDRDGDGYYDGPMDMNVDWVDDDGDKDADLQVIAINPSSKQSTIHAGEAHYMIFEDVDDDNVHGYIDWQTYAFPCWRLTNTTKLQTAMTTQTYYTSFSPDYNGDSIFLKLHMPAAALADARYNWENPFAFYDTDDDGVTEMAIRHCDSPEHKEKDKCELGEHILDGKNEEAYVTFDLDNDAQRGNEMDYDFTFKFLGGEMLEYNKYVHEHPKLAAPEWVLPYFRFTNFRTIKELIYVPHDKCYEESFKPKWGQAWITFDEDDDDHRWERVELYYPERDGKQADPYSVARWGRDKETSFGLCGHPQSDTLGDRGEYDMDFSGKGQIYIGKWDKKIHLFGAEWGAWTVDYKGEYWGSSPVVGDSSPEKAPKVGEVVLYKDTNKNGYIDEIAFDYDGDRTPDLTVSLDELGLEQESELINAADQGWQGMHELFKKISEESWQDAMKVYQAAWKAGIADAELHDLAISASTAEKYEHGYWLKEKVFRTAEKRLRDKKNDRAKLIRAYFGGDIDAMCEIISNGL